MKKILVTGATGFIGNHVVQELLQHGYPVIASSSNKQKAMDLPWFNKVRYIPFDLSGYNVLTDYYRFFSNPDAVIHLAWEGLPNYKSAFHLEVNYPRHAAFLENLIMHGLKDLTVAGTCFEYGMQEGCLREDMPAMPANPYAKAKDKLRRFLGELQQKQPFAFKWVRLFYMYGKGQNPNSLLSQLDKALANNEKIFNMSGGEQIRDYLPVEKMAAYIIKIASQQDINGIINCCSGQPISVKKLVENHLHDMRAEIRLNLGYYPYPDYEPMAFWGDNKKLKTIVHNE